MDVYLVPVGADRYELYCEVPDEPHTAADEQPPQGLIARLRHRFSEMLAEAERERRHGPSEHAQTGWMARTKAAGMRWVAESIAEQRLLWHMRRETDAHLYFPSDLSESTAQSTLRSQLGRDRDRHRFWLVLDSVAFVLSGLLMLLPGPNVLAYYFGFRLVGHFLSMRGARRGLEAVRWTSEGSAPLADLRHAIGLEPDQRVLRVADVANRLRLEHLTTFFERTVLTGGSF